MTARRLKKGDRRKKLKRLPGPSTEVTDQRRMKAMHRSICKPMSLLHYATSRVQRRLIEREGVMPLSVLMRYHRMESPQFDKVVSTLLNRGLIRQMIKWNNEVFWLVERGRKRPISQQVDIRLGRPPELTETRVN